MKKILILVALMFSVAAAKVEASEGTIELRNVGVSNARCFAASILMRDFNYKILLSCRDLVYPAPAGDDLFNYTLWARESGGDGVMKLGTVGVGRGEFESDKAFSQLFITQERNGNARRPSDSVIMVGGVSPIGLLENPATTQVQAPSEPIATPESSPTAQEEDENGGGFSIIRLIGGIVIGVIVFVVIVALISASRRRPIE